MFFFLSSLIIHNSLYSEIGVPENIESLSLNLKQYFDLSNLEYDDSPYPGQSNIGHIFIPNLLIKTIYIDLIIGGWYKHIYVQFDEDSAPKKIYPYMGALLRPWEGSEFGIGNYENLFKFPNSIYNEFLFFTERPVSSGIEFTLHRKTFNLISYLDWLEFDTEEHPEEFITGVLFEHYLFKNIYYKFYNHYHHRGGQLHKDSHPLRIEQDIVTSPLIGFRFSGVFVEMEYYLSTFSQNFRASSYGSAASLLLGYSFTKKINLSYQFWYNNDYYHQDAHIFYLKKKNALNRLRFDYNIYTYNKIFDLFYTMNVYGVDPPGIDFRFFGKINLNIIDFNNLDEEKPPIN